MADAPAPFLFDPPLPEETRGPRVVSRVEYLIEDAAADDTFRRARRAPAGDPAAAAVDAWRKARRDGAA